MNNITKKIISILVISMCVFSFSTQAQATEVATNDSSIEGLDAFFSITSNGTIDFDTDSALERGYSVDAVTMVQDRINFMNNLVCAGEAYINENYGAVVRCAQARTSVQTTYVVYNWDGTTDIFLSDYDAEQTRDAYERVQMGLDPAPIIEYIDASAQPYVYTVCAMGMWHCEIYKNQIDNALTEVEERRLSTGNQKWRVVMHVFYIEGSQNTVYYALQEPETD